MIGGTFVEGIYNCESDNVEIRNWSW